MEKRQITVLPGSPLAKAVERSFQDKTPFWYEGGQIPHHKCEIARGNPIATNFGRLEQWLIQSASAHTAKNANQLKLCSFMAPKHFATGIITLNTRLGARTSSLNEVKLSSVE